MDDLNQKKKKKKTQMEVNSSFIHHNYTQNDIKRKAPLYNNYK